MIDYSYRITKSLITSLDSNSYFLSVRLNIIYLSAILIFYFHSSTIPNFFLDLFTLLVLPQFFNLKFLQLVEFFFFKFVLCVTVKVPFLFFRVSVSLKCFMMLFCFPPPHRILTFSHWLD